MMQRPHTDTVLGSVPRTTLTILVLLLLFILLLLLLTLILLLVSLFAPTFPCFSMHVGLIESDSVLHVLVRNPPLFSLLPIKPCMPPNYVFLMGWRGCGIWVFWLFGWGSELLYIYVCVCVCVCDSFSWSLFFFSAVSFFSFIFIFPFQGNLWMDGCFS
ncbi:hypothetical protein DsansV1_C06g0061381 [Dioscorea sansibarensis]